MVKQKAEQCIQNFLRARNVLNLSGRNGSKRPGMILAGAAIVVPGVLVDNIFLPVTIAMQACYASLIVLGFSWRLTRKKPKGRG